MTAVAIARKSGHEELFLDRYDRLLKWAFQLTRPDRELAKDIVHEAFVQFTRSKGDLDAINNIDNYLYGVLRNIHLSYLRRTSWQQHEQLPIFEFDSAERLMMTEDPRRQIQVKDELRAVCRYVCLRKETSITSSVLILRFFHGYFPSEVAKLLNSSRNIVDVQLKSARIEARACLANATSLGFLGGNSRARLPPNKQDQLAPDLLTELRQEIFATREGSCTQLEQVYVTGEREMTRSALSHLVSCRRCLDEANRLLGLPLLRQRNPIDLGREKRE